MKLILFILILFFAGFTYLVVTLTNNEIADIRSRGAVASSHEAETGTFSGNVEVGNDQNASSGKYIAFGSVLQPTPTPVAEATFPSQIINLTNWKITLPIGSSKPTEIFQPQLATYKLDPWFVVEPGKSAVRFRAPVNAPSTTANSSYPRSELREMKNNGQDQEAWSATNGTHTMFIDQAITAVPKTKRHVVAGQIHDAGNDVIVIRLEYPKLFIDINGDDGPVLDANYVLGKRFTVKFVVNGGNTRIYYNGSSTPAYTLPKSYTGAYFKAGVYTQSNCSKELSTDCVSSNYGEVLIWDVWVTHQ